MSTGVWQVVLVLAIVLILFGAGKLPRVMGDLAKGIKTFKAGMKDEIADAGEVPAGEAKRPEPAARSNETLHG